jgi:FtsH-binding integral membrane protein
MKYNNSYFARESTTHYDEGLRIYMLSIYRNMATALSISALVAYIVGIISFLTLDTRFY